jgi:hypothetical protein
MPMLIVVVPMYNHEKYNHAAIESFWNRRLGSKEAK